MPKTPEDAAKEKAREKAEDNFRMLRSSQMRQLIQMEGWKKLDEWMANEKINLSESCRWNPNNGDQPSVEKLAFLNAFNSGQISFIEKLCDEIARWIRIGDEASKSVKLDEKRKNEKFTVDPNMLQHRV